MEDLRIFLKIRIYIITFFLKKLLRRAGRKEGDTSANLRKTAFTKKHQARNRLKSFFWAQRLEIPNPQKSVFHFKGLDYIVDRKFSFSHALNKWINK